MGVPEPLQAERERRRAGRDGEPDAIGVRVRQNERGQARGRPHGLQRRRLGQGGKRQGARRGRRRPEGCARRVQRHLQVHSRQGQGVLRLHRGRGLPVPDGLGQLRHQGGRLLPPEEGRHRAPQGHPTERAPVLLLQAEGPGQRGCADVQLRQGQGPGRRARAREQRGVHQGGHPLREDQARDGDHRHGRQHLPVRRPRDHVGVRLRRVRPGAAVPRQQQGGPVQAQRAEGVDRRRGPRPVRPRDREGERPDRHVQLQVRLRARGERVRPVRVRGGPAAQEAPQRHADAQ